MNIRARVVKVEGRLVTLGVYVEGMWRRVVARTEVPLEPLSWIEGELIESEAPGEFLFKLGSRIEGVTAEFALPQGIDYEA